MTVLIFLGSLLARWRLGIPIAFSLLLSGVALMWHLDLFDAQILAQNVINGADSSAAGGAVLHARRRDHERRRPEPRIVDLAMTWLATCVAAWASSPSSPPA